MLTEYVQWALHNDVQQAWGDGRKDMAGENHLQLTVGLENVRNLTERVRDLKTRV